MFISAARSFPMKRLLFPILLAVAATPGLAQTDTTLSARIAANGLAATAAELSALTEPSPDERFALGGVQFLAAIETALQTRYRTGMTGALTMMADLPVLRLPVPENPAPEPFDPAIIDVMFARIAADLDGAISALDSIADADAVGVAVNTADIWFDINMSGTRDPGEGLSDVAGFLLSGGFGPAPAAMTIRFDTADAAWLSAYAHLLSGISDVVLAFSPTESITRVLDATAAMQALSPEVTDPLAQYYFSDADTLIDMAAIILGALEQQPDPDLSRAAHAHFLAMIADNRTFWTRVAQEQDNESEWIPNKRQQSVLPIPFPKDTGARWQAVLADAEALLNGRLLIPYWRLGNDAGINLARLFQDPPEMDLAGLIQGHTLVPYMEKGSLVTGTSLIMFEQLVAGDAGLYMVVLN
jgi:hypothetical protein